MDNQACRRAKLTHKTGLVPHSLHPAMQLVALDSESRILRQSDSALQLRNLQLISSASQTLWPSLKYRRLIWQVQEAHRPPQGSPSPTPVARPHPWLQARRAPHPRTESTSIRASCPPCERNSSKEKHLVDLHRRLLARVKVHHRVRRVLLVRRT